MIKRLEMDKCIKVWPWDDAPEHLKALSDNGGDEDWVARVPPAMVDVDIGWMGSAFGCCCIDEYPHPDPLFKGYVVRIGCHA